MPHPKVKLSDDSGNVVAVDTSGASNALKVSLLATPTIDIGDVSLLLGGTAASTNAGTMDAQTLRVTLATDDTHWGTVGTAADSDGTAHGQLRFIGDVTSNVNTNVLGVRTDLSSTNSLLNTIDADTSDIKLKAATIATNTGNLVSFIQTEDTAHVSGDVGYMQLGVRNDTLVSLVNDDGDYAPLQVNDIGALYVTVTSGSVGHDITGGGDGVKTVSSAGTDVVLGGDVACKKIDIQAQTDNTGLIAVGFTGVDATEATGTGVILYAGDTYSLEMVNLNLIYIDSTVSGEGVRYTYFT